MENQIVKLTKKLQEIAEDNGVSICVSVSKHKFPPRVHIIRIVDTIEKQKLKTIDNTIFCYSDINQEV